jgi:hypothetical protein
MQSENEHAALTVTLEIDDLRQSIDERLQVDKLTSITRVEIRELLLMIERLKVCVAELHIRHLPNG